MTTRLYGGYTVEQLHILFDDVEMIEGPIIRDLLDAVDSLQWKSIPYTEAERVMLERIENAIDSVGSGENPASRAPIDPIALDLVDGKITYAEYQEFRRAFVEAREQLDRLGQDGIRERISTCIDVIDRAAQSGDTPCT